MIERPKHYNTTSDAMNKAPSTAYRHASKFRNQELLDSFGFTSTRAATSTLPITSKKIPPALKAAIVQSNSSVSPQDQFKGSRDEHADTNVELVNSDFPDAPTPMSPQVPAIRQASGSPEVSDEDIVPVSEAVSSTAVSDNEEFPPISEPVSSAVPSEAGDDPADDQTSVAQEQLAEAWEDELEENLAPAGPIRGWDVIRKEIKAELKKNSKILPLSRVNQLMILCNFATLRLKGVSRIQAGLQIAQQWHEGKGNWFARRVRSLARHYQLFGKLPRELRGGSRPARSWLHNEQVKMRVLEYLRNVPAGKVTPVALQRHINSSLFPELDIKPKNPLSVHTARCWLIKLGWTHTLVKKGVYMDGHERFDVVHYRNHEFLPAMLKFEAWMAHYEPCEGPEPFGSRQGPELFRVEPNLQPGERELIPLFHDECCFHANDEKNHAWLNIKEGQSVLRKKGRGRLIHVSDFLNPENGRLIIRDDNGNVIEDARVIIYPGSNGDPWWDTKQLLRQVKNSIYIFEKAHPGKQAPYIFDQSSAHASLPDDALKAFEMNKSDGGKQRKQHDTIIPMSNPSVAQRGKHQSMTNSDGTAKGLYNVLLERGFPVEDLRKLRAKCAPVCPIESQHCCLARLLSQQDDFKNQPSQLETLIKGLGHEIIFLPKFHCELNPIEMVFFLCCVLLCF